MELTSTNRPRSWSHQDILKNSFPLCCFEWPTLLSKAWKALVCSWAQAKQRYKSERIFQRKASWTDRKLCFEKYDPYNWIKTQDWSRDDGEGETPVNIPNTEVKSFSAESTWWATAWEDRTSRGLFAFKLKPRKKKMVSGPCKFTCKGPMTIFFLWGAAPDWSVRRTRKCAAPQPASLPILVQACLQSALWCFFFLKQH